MNWLTAACSFPTGNFSVHQILELIKCNSNFHIILCYYCVIKPVVLALIKAKITKVVQEILEKLIESPIKVPPQPCIKKVFSQYESCKKILNSVFFLIFLIPKNSMLRRAWKIRLDPQCKWMNKYFFWKYTVF